MCDFLADSFPFLEYVAACEICAHGRAQHQAPQGLLQPLIIPGRLWSHIALDFVIGLPPSKGNTVIVTIVDWFSKAAHFLALPKIPTALETANLLVDQVFQLPGTASNIVSDRGPEFTSQVWRAFAKALGASVNLLSDYHPPLQWSG